MFQSPSLRGSGRFLRRRERERRAERPVSIPFIAGQWSLPHGRHGQQRSNLVSIPFIAGQWSLLDRGRGARRRRCARFNPLHCGAVVASLVECEALAFDIEVSIPFIAGQWSLLDDTLAAHTLLLT